MTKFLNYVTEYRDDLEKTSRIKEIGFDEAFDKIEQNCQKAFNQYLRGVEITRYSKSTRNIRFGTFNSKNYPERLSTNTLNYYTLIMNNDPTWKAYPRRQVICSINRKMFESFWVVFPYDDVKIGVCSKHDLWVSFESLKGTDMTANVFNSFISNSFTSAGAIERFDNSLAQFKKGCKMFDDWYQKELYSSGKKDSEIIKTLLWGPWSEKIYPLFEKEYTQTYNLYKWILTKYNPKGFKLVKPGNLPKSKEKEVWFDGPALYVNSNTIDDFSARMKGVSI